jgi:hypothetical protein
MLIPFTANNLDLQSQKADVFLLFSQHLRSMNIPDLVSKVTNQEEKGQ